MNDSSDGAKVHEATAPFALSEAEEEMGVVDLNFDQQKAILDHINSLARDPEDLCPVCGGAQSLYPFLTAVGKWATPLGFYGSMWAAVTRCEQCGYLRQFAAEKLPVTLSNG